MRLQALKDKSSECRTSAQECQHIKEFAQMNPGLGKKPGAFPSTANFNGHTPKSLIIYNSPGNAPECRICQNLKSSGDKNNLY